MNQEIEIALKTLLKRVSLPSATGTNKLLDTLNSPFFVTLVGGILLAFISGMLTQCNATNAKDREIALEKLHEKQRFIDSFATKIEQFLVITMGLRKREIFLYQWQADPGRETVHYSDGRTFDETRNRWEEEKRYWVEHSSGTSPLAVIYTGKLLFSNPDIGKKLDLLAESVDLYGRTKEYEALDKAYEQILNGLEEVTSLMAKELHEK